MERNYRERISWILFSWLDLARMGGLRSVALLRMQFYGQSHDESLMYQFPITAEKLQHRTQIRNSFDLNASCMLSTDFSFIVCARERQFSLKLKLLRCFAIRIWHVTGSWINFTRFEDLLKTSNGWKPKNALHDSWIIQRAGFVINEADLLCSMQKTLNWLHLNFLW